MDRRSFLGLPLAAALAKQVMGAENTTPVKWRNGTGTFKNFSREEASKLLHCPVTGLDFDVIEFGRVGSPRHKFIRVYRERICLD